MVDERVESYLSSPAEEKGVATDSLSPDTNIALRLEQSCVIWMKDRPQELTKAGKVMMGIFSVSITTANGCMFLPKHRRFVGIEVDSFCFNELLDGVVKVFQGQCQKNSHTYNVREWRKTMERCYCRLCTKARLEEVSCLQIQYRHTYPHASRSMSFSFKENSMGCTTWSFVYGKVTEHIIYFIAKLFEDQSLFEMAEGLPVLPGSENWHGQFHTINMETRLAVDSGKAGGTIKRDLVWYS